MALKYLKVLNRKKENEDAPQLDDSKEIGRTISMEDYNLFQHTETTASDLESLVMLERAIAKGEQRAGGEINVMKWVAGISVLSIVLVIAAYMAQDLNLF